LRAPAAHGPARVRARDVQRTLAPGVRLIDYLAHDGALHALALTADRVEARRDLARERQIVALVDGMLFQLRGAAFDGGSPALAADLEELASLILWPLLPRELPAVLAVQPIDALARLPWAALPLPDGRALCEACEVVVVPGLRVGLRRAGPQARRLAAPLVVAADAGELPAVRAEAREIAALFPHAQVLAGDAATAERVLALAPRAAWIHFAGHGAWQPGIPEASALRLADRWVTAAELGRNGLAAAWVSLSACQSARSLVHAGEEWFGMPRTLLLAGAESVLASQWDIADSDAAELAVAMYRGIAAGLAPGDALRLAQAERRRLGAHPLRWAGFVRLGGPAPRSRPASRSAARIHPARKRAMV
jgi:hypothetical protein